MGLSGGENTVTLTLDTASAPAPCGQCRQAFGSARALRRHVALDHQPARDGLALTALALHRAADRTPGQALMQRGGPATGAAGLRPSEPPRPTAAATGVRGPGQPGGRMFLFALAGYLLVVVNAVAPLLGMTVFALCLLFAAYLVLTRAHIALLQMRHNRPGASGP